ncbi:MAG: hypothetical protein ACJ746_06440 [Bryobacteraceae bacterium]
MQSVQQRISAAAPPVYRPSAAQPKLPAPPAYRPEQKRLAQPKMASAALRTPLPNSLRVVLPPQKHVNGSILTAQMKTRVATDPRLSSFQAGMAHIDSVGNIGTGGPGYLSSVVQRDKIAKDNDAPIDVGSWVRCREGYVYVTEKYVYKCFANPKAGSDAVEALNKADKGGIPIPDYDYYNATLITSDEKIPVLVIRMKKITGQLFYASKLGGATIFKNRIDLITETRKLARILSGLKNAQDAKMTDPQGFVTEEDQIIFFDVHIGKGTGDAVDKLIEAVQNRLEALA